MTNDSEWGIASPNQLPAETRLGTVRLQVSDLGRSVEYYEAVIGMKALADEGNSVLLGAHGHGTPLVELRERPGARPVPPRGRLGLYHFAILLPDRAALGRVVGHLENIGVAPGSADHLVSEALYLSDPDGLGIEVYADRPRESWRRRGRELAMTTVALDRDGLIGASAGAPWSGLPAGAVIGHVHLHVGDLVEAAAFYHEAIGFDKTTWSYPGALFLSAGGYHHHLGLNTWAPPVPQTEDDARLLEWTVELPTSEDVSAAARAIEEAGYAVEEDETEAIATDLWGTRVRFVPIGPV
ncbi:MAG: VOC family protein [Gemmatimonadota bacterium]